MKKIRFNLTDVLLIAVLILGVAGIIVRAAKLVDAEPLYDREYAVSFTAKTDEKTKNELVTGVTFTDDRGGGGKLLEGYHVKQEGDVFVISADLLMTGRMTSSGFISGGVEYHEGDELTLTYKDGTVRATLTGFFER